MDPDFLVMVLKGVVGFEFDANTGLKQSMDTAGRLIARS